MSWLTKHASRTVQKAHARVTAENAHYVAEAIRQDATIARLTQERDELRERLALIDREEDMRDEIRAKRMSDGLGDQ